MKCSRLHAEVVCQVLFIKYQTVEQTRELEDINFNMPCFNCACQRETTPRRPVGKPLDGTPHGGPLHVLMPLQWSKFRDDSNELTRFLDVRCQRGFTRLAQEFITIDGMLSRGGQESVQCAVLVVSDGKYSFEHQTAKKAQELKDKRIQILMMLISDLRGEEFQMPKQWASQSWQINYKQDSTRAVTNRQSHALTA